MSPATAMTVVALLVLSTLGMFVCVMRLTILIERWYHKSHASTAAHEAATERAAIVAAHIVELSEQAVKMLVVVVGNAAASAKTDEEALKLLRELVSRES